MTEREIFTAARDKGDLASRASFLDEACGGNLVVRTRVERLLRADAEHDVLVDEPALAFEDVAATLMAGMDSSVISCPSSAGRDERELVHFLAPSDRAGSLGRLGRYDVSEVLGNGGFGIVLKALDESLNRVVAVKVLAPHLAASDSSRQRFLREARSSAAVRHENVVQIYSVEEAPLPHLVMEYLAGETLQQRLDRVGRLGAAEVIEIGRQIANGLAAAHAMGLIHRDVKPANVFLQNVFGEPEGVSPRTGVVAVHNYEQQVRGLTPPGLPKACSVKLLDFGLARAVDDVSLTQSGMILGTPLYMSPEQARSEPVDHRADLFSLGCVLYAMLTGDSPFRANGTLATLKRLCEESPRPVHEVAADTPRWLSDLIAKLLAKNPNDRIGSARAVAGLLTEPPPSTEGLLGRCNDADVDQTQDGRPAVGASWLGQETGPNWITSTRTRAACATVAVAVLLGGIVFKLKTKSFEFSVEIPDAASQQVQNAAKTNTRPGQETGHNTSDATGVKETDDADSHRRAVELLRAWDSPPEILITGDKWLRGDELRNQPLPKTPFKIRGLLFAGPDADRLGDGLAEAIAEPLRGVRVEWIIYLKTSRLSTAGLAKLVRLPAFSEIQGLYLQGDRLDDGLFAEAARLPKLTNLNVLECPRVTGQGMSALRSHSGFIILSLLLCSITPEALHELRELPHLEYFNFQLTNNAPLTDAHVTELAATSLEHLVLGNTGLDDRQVERLLGNQSLIRLGLPGNDKITDQLLPKLKPLTRLRYLDFSSTSVTEAAAAELRQALPNCEVVWCPKPKP